MEERINKGDQLKVALEGQLNNSIGFKNKR